MSKTTDKPAIRNLVEICAHKGVNRVVVSPGSRNAPLSIAFHRHPDIETFVVPDERVAAFIAMGMSQQDGKTTALLCTSGSALLNYAPAVAEAYYLHIPIMVISADRPQEWIDQMEGQTMHQENSLANFTRYEITLPQEAKEGDDLWYSDRCVNEAIDASQSPIPGPVHINLPLKEPLYRLADTTAAPKLIKKSFAARMALEKEQLEDLANDLGSHERIMFIIGVLPQGRKFEAILRKWSEKLGVVILSETTSNLTGDRINSCIDRSLECLNEGNREEFLPDMIITFGGPLISKKIKRLLRKHRPKSHWHVDRADAHIDSFQSLTRAIQADSFEFLNQMAEVYTPSESEFSDKWYTLLSNSQSAHKTYLDSCDWSDLKAFSIIMPAIPSSSSLQMASSSPVRYAQLFDSRPDLNYFSNRGVSGIDGCTSTAVGTAMATNELVTLITGDMAFYYDSNALWHKHLPDNLRIIVINNGGGGIFRIIPGPRDADELEEYFEAHMDNRAEKLAVAYGIDYLSADDEDSLKAGLEALYQKNHCCILEIFTPRKANAPVLDAYFENLQK